LIRDRRRYSFAMLDFFIELDALVAHGQFPPLKGNNPRDRVLFAPRGHGSKLGRAGRFKLGH
jgi:hypothetical protein